MTYTLSIHIDGWTLIVLAYFIMRLTYRVRKAERRLDAIESRTYRNPTWKNWVWGWL